MTTASDTERSGVGRQDLAGHDYRSIVEALQEGIWIIDENSKTTFVNVPMARMLGYSPEDMIGHELFSFMDRRGTEIAEENLERRLQGIAEQHDFEFLHRDGSRVFTAMATAPITDDDGQYRGAVAGVLDISERRRAEDAMRASEARFRAVFEDASVAIVVAGLDGRVEQVNPAMERMFGYSNDELTRKSVADLTHPEDRAATARVFQGMIDGGRGQHIEKRYLRSDGNVVHAVVSVSAIRGADGKPTHAVAMLQDVTELRHAQNELVRAQRLESLGILAGGIAHDYNNILTAVLANVALAREEAVPGSEQEQLLRAAEDASHQAIKLARQLLTFSRGGAPVLAPIDLGKLLRETVRFSMAGSPLRCECTFDSELWCVVADSGQLGQVLSNLITNAQQAQPDGGTIEVHARNVATGGAGAGDAGRHVEVTVTDHGQGIAPANLPHVFDPYFTTKPDGTGLGLAVTHRVIQDHGGSIRVESTPGQGTTFSVLLPVEENLAPPCSQAERARPDVRANVLVMDDEPAIRRVLRVALSRRGCSVTETSDGAEAIACWEEAANAGEPFDVAILDLTVPGGMGGIETLMRLRQLDPGVKAIVSSGYSSDSAMATHEERGFSGVLAKPYRPADIEAVLAKVLSE